MRFLRNRILLFSVFVPALPALRFHVFHDILSFERRKDIDLIPPGLLTPGAAAVFILLAAITLLPAAPCASGEEGDNSLLLHAIEPVIFRAPGIP